MTTSRDDDAERDIIAPLGVKAPLTLRDHVGLPAPLGRALRQSVFSADSTTRLPRASGLQRVHRSGDNPLRVLLFGGGATVGIGVLTHDRGIGAGIADVLHTWTGHGVTLDILIQPDVASKKAIEAIRTARIERYDAVVIALGLECVAEIRSPARWRDQFGRLVEAITALVSPDAPIVVIDWNALSDIPGFAPANTSGTGLLDERLARQTEAVCTQFPGVRYLPGERQDPSKRLSVPAFYAKWGATVGKHLAIRIIQSDYRAGGAALAQRDQPDDEGRRQMSVDSSGLARAVSDPRLTQLVRAARLQYGTSHAELNLIDGDIQRTIASADANPAVIPRSSSICALTIQHAVPTVLEDATVDRRVTGNPSTPEGAPIRFYAGVPIEAPDGYRIGALCVYDSERKPGGQDAAALMTLAAEIEHRVWELMTEPVAR